jgi:hypothetical protein
MPFWVQNGWFKDFKKILFGLNGPFWGQKASFKTVLGPILESFRRYYSWLPWSDPNNTTNSCFIEPVGRKVYAGFRDDSLFINPQA